MTQYELIKQTFRRIPDEVDPQSSVIACEFNTHKSRSGICDYQFEPDTTYAQLWDHLKIRHGVLGERQYQGNNDAVPVFELAEHGT